MTESIERRADTERVIGELIQGVLAMAEATRVLASAERVEPELMHEVRLHSDALSGLVELVESAIHDEITLTTGAEPEPPLPSGEIVESLDELFGGL